MCQDPGFTFKSQGLWRTDKNKVEFKAKGKGNTRKVTRALKTKIKVGTDYQTELRSVLAELTVGLKLSHRVLV